MVDSYLTVTLEVLVLALGLKQLLLLCAIPWIDADGWDATFAAMAGISFGIMAFGLPLWYYGKRIVGIIQRCNPMYIKTCIATSHVHN